MEGIQYTSLEIKGESEMPLAFYINGNEFIMGEYARDRAASGDQNAFSNYFELIKDPINVFDFIGEKRPVKQLLYFGIERYLTHFLREVLFSPEWSIESHRPVFPLRIWFDTDILDNERVLVTSLFLEAGYKNLEVINFRACLLAAIANRKLCDARNNILLLTGIDNDLYLHLFLDGKHSVISQSFIAGVGSDPRTKLLAELMFEYITSDNPYVFLYKEKEIPFLLKEAIKVITDSHPIKMGNVTLSNGLQCEYSVLLSSVNDRLQYYTGHQKIYAEIDSLLVKNSIPSISVTIFLNGEDINTDYFIERLRQKYPNVKGISEKVHLDAMKILFNEIESSGYKSANSPQNNKEIPPLQVKSPIPPLSAPVKPSLPAKPPQPLAVSSLVNKPTLPPLKIPLPQQKSAVEKKTQVVKEQKKAPLPPQPKKEVLDKTSTKKGIKIPPPPIPEKKTKSK